jgi:alpha-glucosidase
MLLNLSLSGVAFCGGDAGGFQGNASGELFARWMQYAAFTPFFRAHSAIDSKPHEPWAFGPETERVSREAITLRYRLMPYLYGEMRRASVTGLPVIRPMVFEFPRDPEVKTMCDQFMFGPSILVAPVTQPGKKERLVYLPEGIWYDWHTSEKIDGGRSIVARAPLDVIPIYARAGSLIPMVEPAMHTGAIDFSRVTVRAYSGSSGSYELYEDDGITTEYMNGSYNLLRLSIENGDGLGPGHASGTSGTAAPRVAVEVLHHGWEGGCQKPKIEII